MFDLTGKNALVLGGTGVLGTAMCRGLAQAGANVAVGARTMEKANALADELKALGVRAAAYKADATVKADLEAVAEAFARDFGDIHILISGVGGNKPAATCAPPAKTFFDLDLNDFSAVVDMNLIGGAVLPAQVFGKLMCESEDGGVIINVSSMNYLRPLTNIPAYSAAKAAVSNFTQWLAVDLARRYGEKVRVNAIAPGFFLTDQNRFLLTDAETGELTPRGKSIIAHTPVGRMGVPEDLISTIVWLSADESKFVNGVVVPVDGGFAAYSGV